MRLVGPVGASDVTQLYVIKCGLHVTAAAAAATLPFIVLQTIERSVATSLIIPFEIEVLCYDY